MPVRKFRSVEDMTPAREARPYDPQNLRAAIELSRTCMALSRLRPSPGVHKYHSIDARNDARRRFEEGTGSDGSVVHRVLE